ncbi:uncharacterized protein LOC127362140 [Dicentrarchus labrax]|uniref:uncharacterized protein LOC127362140 n=1 Tax=Dicentrarchus labrax TaxID=13489 RepID=UPI0021F5303C|nr:uncharacterized protein LOC127362140 [Dicentrarchus labrax]
MHQHTHPHAFPPTLHQSLTILPAPMASQDNKFSTHLPRGTTRPSFAPVTAFHRATQKSFGSTKRGKWGAMHVCIAWKIYYHEQLKRTQQKPNSVCRDLTPEYPATSLHNSVQLKESDQSSCIHPNLDSPRGHSGKTAKNERDMNTSYPSDLNPRSPCHIPTTKREKLEQAQNLHPEKEKHGCQQTDTAKDTSWDLTMTPELHGRQSGSRGRKRQFECDGFIQVKRVKKEVTDDQFDSSKTLHTDPTYTHPSSHTVPVQHISDLHPNSRFNVTRIPGGLISYPAAEVHPYQAASWDAMWDVHQRMDLHSGQNVLKDYSQNTCKAIRIPLVAQSQIEAFHGFFAPPLYLPLALRQQDTVYLRGREFLQPRYDNCHLHRCRHQLSHPGFLATPYLGP